MGVVWCAIGVQVVAAPVLVRRRPTAAREALQSPPAAPLSAVNPRLPSAAAPPLRAAQWHPGQEHDLPWTAPTSLPTRPCAWLAALLTVLAALLAAVLAELAADSAELLTLVRPSDALDWTLEAASPAFSFAAPAASDVVEALRMPARRTANRDWRTSARDAAKDMVMVRRRGWAMEGGVDARLSQTLACRARAFFHLALRMY